MPWGITLGETTIGSHSDLEARDELPFFELVFGYSFTKKNMFDDYFRHIILFSLKKVDM